jgi:hypothetical protein
MKAQPCQKIHGNMQSKSGEVNDVDIGRLRKASECRDSATVTPSHAGQVI